MRNKQQFSQRIVSSFQIISYNSKIKDETGVVKALICLSYETAKYDTIKTLLPVTAWAKGIYAPAPDQYIYKMVLSPDQGHVK